MPRGLTVLAPVRHGEAEPLRDVLRAIGDDITGKTAAGGAARPHIDFSRSRTMHFARLTLLRDPPRGPDAMRLLFSSNYDGALGDHLAELVEITSDMEAIWGRCEGWQGTAAFLAFIRRHAIEPAAFYVAMPAETVDGIQHARAVRRRLRDALEADPSKCTAIVAEARRKSSPGRRALGQLRSTTSRFLRALPIAGDVLRVLHRQGFRTAYRAASRITASLNRYPVFRLANWLTRNRLPPRTTAHSSVDPDSCTAWKPLAEGDEIPAPFDVPPSFREDVVAQNQLTLVTVVDPRQVTHVRAVMAAIDAYARRLAPPGSLLGISTIHFVRWLLVDDDRRLVMLSDYDGSWENYIDEFAEMILSGLDAIWDTSYGYPPDGARDLPAFKRFLRAHQVPAEVFFSAYPDQTLLNVTRNTRLARAVDTGSEPLDKLLPTL